MTTTSSAPAFDATPGGDVGQAVRAGAVQTQVRPVVQSGSGRVVGYDVVVSGRSGVLEQPAAFRDAVQASPDAAELGTLCRRAAMRAVAAVGPGAGDRTRVFLDSPVEALATLAEEEPALRQRLVLQIDSARVLSHPAATLRAAERARRDGWTVAVRGVGASVASLAVLPLLDPEIVRLDVERPAGLRAAPDERGLRGGAHPHGPDRQHRHGRRCHVALGRVHVRMLERHPGRGAALPRPGWARRGGGRRRAHAGSGARSSCWRRTAARSPSPAPGTRPGRGQARPHRRQQGDRARGARRRWRGDDPVLLPECTSPRPEHAAAVRRYRRAGCMVAMLGEGIDAPPVPHASSATLDAADPLRREWTIVVITSSWTRLLTAHDFGDAGADADRRFSYVLTDDRDLAVEAARSLLARTTDAASTPFPTS